MTKKEKEYVWVVQRQITEIKEPMPGTKVGVTHYKTMANMCYETEDQALARALDYSNNYKCLCRVRKAVLL